MARTGNKRLTLVVAAVLVFALLVPVGHAWASAEGITLVPASRFGSGVDERSGGNGCAVGSGEECQTRGGSSGAGGSYYPASVAVDPKTNDIYVADVAGDRVQELTATGAFISMFGWDVNETKDKKPSAGQVEKNLCTAASKDLCRTGVPGTKAGQLAFLASVTVDPVTGDVYVLQSGPLDFSVDKYTSDGRLLWMLGRGVNRRTKGDLCREPEIKRGRCGAGAENPSESTEHGAFKSTAQSGDLLAVGGPKHLLYVGDEHRVQVFAADGQWKREIPLESLSGQPHSSVVALALNTSGDLYLAYRAGPIESYLPTGAANIVHELGPNDEQIAEYPVLVKHFGALDSINGMALDRQGQLAIIGVELGAGSSGRFGLLYQTGSGRLT